MKKLISFALVLALIAPVSPITFAEPVAQNLSLGNLAIPESLGKVESRHQGESERWVVHIQDVHAHFTAQENIAAIVDHLHTIYGVKTIALEGGTGEQTFKESWGLPPSREKHMLARELLERDYLTGPGYAALFSKAPLHLVGIEEDALYEKNRALFARHLKTRAEIEKHYASLEKSLTQEKRQIFNADLRSFDEALHQFREGKKPELFIPNLVKQCQKANIPLNDLDQIMLFVEIMQNESFLDKHKLESEAERLMKEFKRTGLHFEELLRSGKLTEEKLEFYPASMTYLHLMRLQDKLHPRSFFEQIEIAITRLAETLYQTPDEKALMLKSERLRLAKKMIFLQATPMQLEALESNIPLLERELAAFNLSDAFRLANDFYETAKARDDIFFNKIISDQRLSGNIAVVTGGFHTEGLSEKLEKAGISYLVVTPDLADEAPDEDLYFKRMMQDLPKSQTVQTKLKFLISPAEFDRQFMQALSELRKTRNILLAIEIFDRSEGAFKPRSKAHSVEIVDWALFESLSLGEQNGKIYSWLEMVENGKLPIVLLVRTSQLEAMLETSVGLTLWETVIAPNRLNTVALIQDGDYLDQTIGIRARIIRLPEETDMNDVLQRRFAKDLQNQTIAVIDPEYQDPRVLVLPSHPLSLLLARLFLENGVRLNYEQADFVQLIHDRLLEIFEHENVLRQAA